MFICDYPYPLNGEGLAEVVSDINGSYLNPLAEVQEQLLKFFLQALVKVAEGFVHEHM